MFGEQVSSMKSDVDYLVDNFCEDWLLKLDRQDKVSFQLQNSSFCWSNHSRKINVDYNQLAIVLLENSDIPESHWKIHLTRCSLELNK